jgi:hypothetical protein
MHKFDSVANKPANLGRWKIETRSEEELGVTFEGFQFRSDLNSLKPPGIWHVKVERSLFSGSLKLCFDPDLGSCFVMSK